MKLFNCLLAIMIISFFTGLGCSSNRATLGRTSTVQLTNPDTGKTTEKIVFKDGNIAYKATNIGFGGGTSPIDLATAEAIRKDAENRTVREQIKNAVLTDYMNNPKKYGNGKFLEKAGILSTSSGGYKILIFNNTGRPLNVAVSGNTEGYLLRDKGYQSFLVDTRKFSVYAYEVDNTPFKSKNFKIPSPTPKIPAFGRGKL